MAKKSITQEPLIVAQLKGWRKQHRLTQVQAAEWLRVSLRTYQGWEQGRRKTHVALVRLAMRVAKPKKGASRDPAQMTFEDAE